MEMKRITYYSSNQSLQIACLNWCGKINACILHQLLSTSLVLCKILLFANISIDTRIKIILIGSISGIILRHKRSSLKKTIIDTRQ